MKVKFTILFVIPGYPDISNFDIETNSKISVTIRNLIYAGAVINKEQAERFFDSIINEQKTIVQEMTQILTSLESILINEEDYFEAYSSFTEIIGRAKNNVKKVKAVKKVIEHNFSLQQYLMDASIADGDMILGWYKGEKIWI